MSDFDDGCVSGILWLITVAISIGAGMLAWNWIEPDNFWRAVVFIIVWGIFTTIGYYISLAIIWLICYLIGINR